MEILKLKEIHPKDAMYPHFNTLQGREGRILRPRLVIMNGSLWLSGIFSMPSLVFIDGRSKGSITFSAARFTGDLMEKLAMAELGLYSKGPFKSVESETKSMKIY